jgi:hypothetical protein
MVLSNATCTVYVAGTSTAATLYSDNGITPLANPFLSSSTGQVAFYAANGLYDLVVSKIGYLTVTISAIELDDLLAPSGSNSVGYLPAGTGAVATTVQTKLRESVSVKDFGAVGDGTTDDTSAIQAAMNYAAPLGYVIYFPPGTYRTTATVGFTKNDAQQFGVQIVGSGLQKSYIEADHLAGPVLSLNRSNGLVQDISLTASATRTAGAAGNNYGLLLEAPDNATAAVAQMAIVRVRAYGQPSHGFVHVGNMIESYYEQALAQLNKGHGFVFDTGVITSRTNVFYPGLVNLISCWSLENTGHGLKIGDASDSAAINTPLRFVMLNCEFSDNALTAGVRVSADEVWIRGMQMTFDTCAMGSSASAVVGNIRFAGEHLQIRNHRSVQATHTLRVEADHVLTTTFGIRVDGLRVLNTAQNPVVIVSSLTAVRDIQVATHGDQSNMTTMFTSGAVRAFWDLTLPFSDAVTTATQTVNNTTTLVDVTQLAVYLAASESVFFEAVVRHNGDSTADIKIAFVAPAGATIRWDNDQSIYIAAGDAVTISNAETSEGATRAFGAAAGTRTITIRGWVVMSTTAGALQMQFAQNTATVADTSILAGSTLRVLRQNTNV